MANTTLIFFLHILPRLQVSSSDVSFFVFAALVYRFYVFGVTYRPTVAKLQPHLIYYPFTAMQLHLFHKKINIYMIKTECSFCSSIFIGSWQTAPHFLPLLISFKFCLLIMDVVTLMEEFK